MMLAAKWVLAYPCSLLIQLTQHSVVRPYSPTLLGHSLSQTPEVLQHLIHPRNQTNSPKERNESYRPDVPVSTKRDFVRSKMFHLANKQCALRAQRKNRALGTTK